MAWNDALECQFHVFLGLKIKFKHIPALTASPGPVAESEPINHLPSSFRRHRHRHRHPSPSIVIHRHHHHPSSTRLPSFVTMSEFPELEGFSNVPSSTDPTDDFLARERALLGDEFGGVPDNYKSEIVTDSGDQFGLGNFSAVTTHIQPAPVHVSVTDTNDDLAAFQDQYPDLSHDISPAKTNGLNPSSSAYSNPALSNLPSTYSPVTMEEESEFIKEWRVRQAEEIRLRDQQSAAKREETIAAAEKAIDDFYHAYNTQKEKNIARNKEQEAEFLQSRDDALARGTTWQRITDLIELQDSRSKTCGKSTRDLSRFKEILLSLKREGENAPGAAGY
ncbi:hypothetical protein O181_017373 [Austropuccinia psidii MF-1]|uniref:Clathrin light chain n=1 Tax=Austropuccinia psidii MF-1 TaxID=1389203 RepID=A0A9Q3C701_9BASI|nr:hypothetical protein [Austropuccinia psidii MF-1]